MSKEGGHKSDYLGDIYRLNIVQRGMRGHSIEYVSVQAASLNILAKILCTDGAEYSSVILPHGTQDLPIYVSHPHGYREFNAKGDKIFLTSDEINIISRKLKIVLYDVNNEENKQSLLRSLVRAQNPFLEQLIYQHKELLVGRLTQDMKAESQRIKNNDEYKKICKAYEQRINNITKKDSQDVATDYCTTIFPKFLNDQDLRDISQYKDRQFLKVQDSSSEGRSYKGVHVEAQGVDFAYYQHKGEINEFSIGLAKKDTNPETGCCAGCALEFKILSLRESGKIIVHRSADFPINMPTSQSYKPSALMSAQERKLFDKIIPPRELFQGSVVINDEQNIRMQKILSDKITTIQQLESKIEEFTQQTQNSKGKRQELKQKLVAKTSELEANQKENAELSQKLSASEEKLKEKDQELNQNKAIITELGTKLEASKQEETRLVTECTSLKQDFETKEKELNQSKEENRDLSEKIKSSTKENQKLILHFKDSQQKLEAKTSELDTSQKRNRELIEEIQAVQKQNKTLEEKLTSKTSELEKTTHTNETLIKQVQEAEKRKTELAAQLKTFTKDLAEKNKTLETSKEHNTKLSRENDTLKNQLKKLRQELEEKNRTLDKSPQYVNVNAPSTGTSTNIEAQNLQPESPSVVSNLGQHSPPPRSPDGQPKVKKQKVEPNLEVLAQAEQIRQELAVQQTSSNSSGSVPEAPGKRPESPSRAL